MKRSGWSAVAGLLVASCVLTLIVAVVFLRLRGGRLGPQPETERVRVASLPPGSFRAIGDGQIVMAAFSPDGRTLVTATRRGLVFYDTDDYRLRPSASIESSRFRGASEIAWSPDGQALAVASYAIGLVLFDPATGRQTRTFDESSDVGGVGSYLAWSPDGRTLAATVQVMDQENVVLWDTQTGARVAELRNTRFVPNGVPRVGGLAWSPDGRNLAVSYSYGIDPNRSEPDELLIWETGAAPAVARQWSLPDIDVDGLAWTPDGRSLITSSPSLIHVFDAGDGRTVASIAVEMFPGDTMTLSPDGQQIAVGGRKERITLYAIPDLARLEEINIPNSDTDRVAWSPDGETLVVSSSFRSEFFVWSLADRALLTHVITWDDSTQNLAWSPDSRRLATGAQDGRARIFAADTGARLFTVGERVPLTWPKIAWSPDGHMLATTSERDENAKIIYTTHIWSDSGAPLAAVEGNLGGWSPTNGRLIVLPDRQLQQWQVGPAGPPRLVSEELLLDYGYDPSPTGELFAQTRITRDAAKSWLYWESIVIRRVNDSGQVVELSQPGMSFVRGLAWSPDGRLLAVSYTIDNERGSYRHANLTVWSTTTWQVVRSFDNLDLPSESLSWSPDSQWIAATAAPSRSNLALYPLSDAQLIREIDTHLDKVESVAWSPDGRWIASSESEGQVTIWDAAALLP